MLSGLSTKSKVLADPDSRGQDAERSDSTGGKKWSLRTMRTKVWQNPCYFLAFGFGSGLMPKAPGTWGTVAAIPLYLLIAHCSWPVYLLLTLMAFIAGIWFCDAVTRELGIHDFSGIVWDEIVGYLLTLFLMPVKLECMIAGFILFRLFDIWKPQPIRWIDQRVQGGLGIMLDDVLAAIPAWCILWLGQKLIL